MTYNIQKVNGLYDEFLKDESKKTGDASSISFPVTEKEVRETLAYMKNTSTSVTLQGARTGITAGAVPMGGHILNLSRMDKVTGISFDKKRGSFFLMVQPGVILSRLREMLSDNSFDTTGWSEESIKTLNLFQESGSWFFPPDPTETTATIGGMVSCNSSGACSFFYGPTRNFIESLDIILMDGSALNVRRGRDRANGRVFEITNDAGKTLKGNIPSYELPVVKNASGYFASENMDLVDLFIGSEGTLGVITSMVIRLLPLPACIWGLITFFSTEEQALAFVKEVRKKENDNTDINSARLVAIEFFNSNTLKLLRRMKKEYQSFSGIPELPDKYNTAVYTEFHGKDEESVDSMVMNTAELFEACGSNSEDTWIATNKTEMERLHTFRHAVPESVNMVIGMRKKNDDRLTKLGTDMAVPDEKLDEVMAMYNRDIAESALDSVIFGHIGDNHLHVNILPENMQNYEKGWQLYHDWARKVIRMGGTVSAEHGIGKIKTAFLEYMFGAEGIRQMREMRLVFESDYILNTGNLY